jgi:transposase
MSGLNMGKPLSMDLRTRAIAAVDEGSSRRAAAARYGVAPSTVIRWDKERRLTGSFSPKPQGGDMRSRGLEAHADLVHALREETPDITLAELRQTLSERGVAASISSLWRFFRRHGITRKKDRPRRRTGSRGRPEEASGLVRRATRPGPRPVGVHR